MSEPRDATGDPWIDAYPTFRQAWLDGATESELTDLAAEYRRELPSPTPPVPAAMFIHSDILITAEHRALAPQPWASKNAPPTTRCHVGGGSPRRTWPPRRGPTARPASVFRPVA